MSQLYKKENRKTKRKSKKKKSTLFLLRPRRIKTSMFDKRSINHRPPQKYVSKRIILDDLREYRNSKTISSVSNTIAEIVVQATAKELSNSQKNMLRSLVALATAEALSKAFEKELKAIEKVKTFVKIGKVVYRVILWYDENSKTYQTDAKHVKEVSEVSFQYKNFLKIHPRLKKLYDQQCLSLAEIQLGKPCAVKAHLDRIEEIRIDSSLETPNSCPYYYYCHN